MLNKDLFARDPSSYDLADGGIAKVLFPPENDPNQLAVLREQLQTFVCEGGYADGLSGILRYFNGKAGRLSDLYAFWLSGFYGSGKSLLATMLGALWTNIEFEDGATAEGLVQNIPAEVRAELLELRANGKRLGGLLVGGATLGRGSKDPVKAVLEIVLKATGLMKAAGPASTFDLRPWQVALWLEREGVLAGVRETLGNDFDHALGEFLLNETLAAAALEVKPDMAPDVDTLMERLGRQFGEEPEPTPELLVEMARRALLVGRKEIPLTLIILDEVQQYVREDVNISLVIQTIAEELCSKFNNRVFLVGTGQSALGDVRYLERLLTRFRIPIPLRSADINSVIRKTILLKRDTAKPEIERMLDLRSGEIDKQLQGSSIKHSAADRPNDLADWPILASRRRFWQHVLDEVDRSGRAINLRGQLAITLDAVKRYGDKPFGVAVSGDFLFDTFAAEALSRNLISQEIYDRIALLRAQPNDGSLKARILILVYLIARIAGDAQNHGVYAKPDILGDLLIEDLSDAASVRAKIPNLLAELQDEGAVIEVNGEQRLQTKESAEWQAAFNRAQAQAASDPYLVPRHRSALLQLAIDDALAAVGNIQQGISKTTRRIERVVGDTKPGSDGLLVRLWNGWDHALPATLNDIRAADVAKDATIHMIIAEHRREELRNAIAAREAATATIQTQGVPSTNGGKEAKAAMESRLKHEEETAKTILREAVDKAQVLVAGGAEVGSDLTRADAIRDAGNRVLDRLYPEFGAADHAGWDRVVAQARKRVPDALKEVGHTGDAQDHSVCKAFLRFLKPAKRGSELRTWFAGPPYGWPREALDAAMLALANAGQVKVTGADGKPAVTVDLNATQLGTCTFAPETRVISASERIAVRALGLALGLSVPSGEENNYLLTIVDRLAQIAEAAGGEAPAPKPPEVPGMTEFRSSTGNDLLAELAARHDELKPLIAQWQAAKTEKEARLRSWALATRLVALGAREQQSALDAIRTARALLSEPDPLPSLVSAAADDLRNLANAAYNSWQRAWDTGEARLKADAAWNKISPEKKHALRVEHALLPQDLPDLSTPEKIVESLTSRGLAGWRDMAAALPTRVETALRDAAVEVEPKTQTVAMPRRVIRSEPDLDAWLDEIRKKIAPLLASGPVWPAA